MFLIRWVLAVVKVLAGKVAVKVQVSRAARSGASADKTRIAAATVPHAVLPLIAPAIHLDAATMAIPVNRTC